METKLAVELKIRSPRKEESKKAEILFNKHDMHITGEKNAKADIISKTWEFPQFDLHEDTRVIVNEKNEWLGYIAVWNDNAPYIQNFIIQKIDPDYIGTEVEKKLLEWAEHKSVSNISKAPKDAEVFMGLFLDRSQKGEIQRVKKLGFSEKRYFWRMGIDLENGIEEPDFPEGITITTFSEKDNLMDIVKCDRACFEDHWGYAESPLDEEYKEWEHWIKTEPYYDPSCWFLACLGDEIVGMSLCANGMVHDENIGYLDSVCVRKEFRKKGIASSLLKHSFKELKKAGRNKAYLHVDADSLTGATKLYEGVGMKTNQFSIIMEKIIQKGKSYRTENI